MQRDATPSGIFEWIGQNCRPMTTDAQTLRFERMESQAGHKLPEIHLPLDHHDVSHWHHRGMIWDYVLSLDGATRVLDVGPGDGWPSLLMAPHFKEVVGIEPGPKRIEVCRANARRMHVRNVQFEMMSACDMDFRASSFDGVVAATSIEQTPNPTAALNEIYRILKVGGILRLTYEVMQWIAEPVREVISVQLGIEGAYQVDYVVSWMDRAEEQTFLLDVVPLTDGNKKRLELWAKRCKDDLYPHRDPRLERGLAQTIKALRKAEILKARSFKIHHFKSQSLVHALSKIGFTDIRCIAGGGWPAQQCAMEMIRSRRIEAAAPLMEEICRSAARIGVDLVTERPGNIIARKPKGGGKAIAKPKASASQKPKASARSKTRVVAKPKAGTSRKPKAGTSRKPKAGTSRKPKAAARSKAKTAPKLMVEASAESVAKAVPRPEAGISATSKVQPPSRDRAWALSR